MPFGARPQPSNSWYTGNSMAFGHWDPPASLEDIPICVLGLRLTKPLVRGIMNWVGQQKSRGPNFLRCRWWISDRSVLYKIGTYQQDCSVFFKELAFSNCKSPIPHSAHVYSLKFISWFSIVSDPRVDSLKGRHVAGFTSIWPWTLPNNPPTVRLRSNSTVW